MEEVIHQIWQNRGINFKETMQKQQQRFRIKLDFLLYSQMIDNRRAGNTAKIKTYIEFGESDGKDNSFKY